jgi:hypothetical protein
MGERYMLENLLVVLRPFGTLYGEMILAKLFILALALNYLYNHEKAYTKAVRAAARQRAKESLRNGADTRSQSEGYANDQEFAKFDFKGYMRRYEAKHGKQGKIATWLIWLGFESSDKQDR